jgi:hypothetical protein
MCLEVSVASEQPLLKDVLDEVLRGLERFSVKASSVLAIGSMGCSWHRLSE